MSYASTPPATDVNINITGDITTNNASTTKHGFLLKLGGGTTNFLRADGTWNAPASGGRGTVLVRAANFDASGRYLTAVTGSGTATFGASGIDLDTTATATSSAKIQWFITGTNIMAQYDGSPLVGVSIRTFNTSTTTGSAYMGQGNVTVDGSGHTYTVVHVGFKIIVVASVLELHATQADGTTENASASLRTVATSDAMDLVWKTNGSTSVDYYWRNNGGAQSAATNLTTNLPTGSQSDVFLISVSNNGSAASSRIISGSAFHER